ncbi:MAG: hypothetical protein HYX99_04935 [Chloroflexi bacterium]|nr:hypothetical protein [Chloroflexota bacterium]
MQARKAPLEKVVMVKEETIPTSYLAAEGAAVVVHIPNWLPRALRTIYIRHELGHLNYLDWTGRVSQSPLDAVRHNLHAFCFEMCPCAGPLARSLLNRGAVKMALGEVRPQSFLCRRAPRALAFPFMLVAALTLPFLWAIHLPCLRRDQRCLLHQFQRDQAHKSL